MNLTPFSATPFSATDDPAAYRWSSCAANLARRLHSRLNPHPAWRALGATNADCATVYRRLLNEAMTDDTLAEICIHLQQQSACGRDDFRAMVEAKTLCFAGTHLAHRPRKATQSEK